MSGENKTSQPPIENWDTFQARLDVFPLEERLQIDFAYQIAKAAHRPQWRLGGERYFEHLRGAALILLDECKIQSAPIICAALLHDTLEDTALFGNPSKTKHSQWIAEANWLISKTFWPQTAEIVIAVTEPFVDDIEIMSETQAKKIKYNQLSDASPEALLVKMADRLHNLRTFYPKPGAKTPAEKIRETEEILIPIFQRAADTYPAETKILLEQIDEAIHKLRLTF